MARKRLPYREGDWFAVPLSCGGYALGLVARMDDQGLVLAYFFQPRCDSLPSPDQVARTKPEHGTVVAMVGAVGLIEGRWKVVGRLDPWDPTKWPVPVFGRYDDLTGRGWRVIYADPDIGIELRREPTTAEEVRNLPEDGLWGYIFAEERLSRLLCKAPD